MPAGGSGNRTVIIGSANLHCQPPAMELEFPPNTYGEFCIFGFVYKKFLFFVFRFLCDLLMGWDGGGLKEKNVKLFHCEKWTNLW